MAKRKARRPQARTARARKAARKTARAGAARRAGRGRAAKKAAKKKTARKKASAARRPAKAARRPAKVARRPARTARKTAKTARKIAGARRKSAASKTRARTAAPRTKAPARKAPGLDRPRRTVQDTEITPGPPSSLNPERHASASRSGQAGLVGRLRSHTSTGPEMTGGDIDADWESAESVGDEAPGGDNPTPDQDVVDNIGRAVGIEYEADEELKGGDEVGERDRHRWELDPASSDDYDER